MKAPHPVSALVWIPMLTLTLTVPGEAGEEARYAWRTDLGVARELAAAERKPMLIVFRCEP